MKIFWVNHVNVVVELDYSFQLKYIAQVAQRFTDICFEKILNHNRQQIASESTQNCKPYTVDSA